MENKDITQENDPSIAIAAVGMWLGKYFGLNPGQVERLSVWCKNNKDFEQRVVYLYDQMQSAKGEEKKRVDVLLENLAKDLTDMENELK